MSVRKIVDEFEFERLLSSITVIVSFVMHSTQEISG